MSQDGMSVWTHEEFCRAIETGEGFYLACPDGHGSVPPHRVCPHCGAQTLTAEPLPETGRVQAATVVHVATAAFADSVPYVTAVADFGLVSLTGIVSGATDSVERGTEVTVGIERTEGRERPTLVFEPR